MNHKTIERRQFLKQAAVSAAIGLALPGRRVLGANDRVRLGIIGPGARGQELIKEFLKVADVEFVAAADVFTRRHEEAKKLAPIARTFDDHRRLLDPEMIQWTTRRADRTGEVALPVVRERLPVESPQQVEVHGRRLHLNVLHHQHIATRLERHVANQA